MALSIAIVGVGKIARDQHIPQIALSRDFDLAATVSRSGGVPGVHNHADLSALIAAPGGVEAVALCQPPQGRFEAASQALQAGLHVFLEKPPGATLSEVQALSTIAGQRRVTLFASWHSRFAAGVDAARDWLKGRRLRSVTITWKEDVRRWHPGQAWIWQPGGLGVFDPGINALSIVTEILDQEMFLTSGDLFTPQNRDAPIAADLVFRTVCGAPVTAAFDWRQEGEQTWRIEVDTDDGLLVLDRGGASLTIGGLGQAVAERSEYGALYSRFAELIRQGRSEVDLRPLQHVADAFLRARNVKVAAFED